MTAIDLNDPALVESDFAAVTSFPSGLQAIETLVLVVARVPTSTGVRHVRGDRFEVTGDLTIAGTTKSVVLDMVLDGVVGDPWGGTRLAFSAATEIDREEFGITWNVALETGGVLVGKKVKIELEGQAVRQ